MRIAGIGSRSTPPDVLAEMVKIGEHAAASGWLITSGHADGADYAFETGAKQSCIVYLPWHGFNSSLPMLGRPCVIDQRDDLDEMVRKHHPAAHMLSRAGWALMRRNACQVLGKDLNKRVDAVICWTDSGKEVGGTAQAMRIARANDIPVINMFSRRSAASIIELLSSGGGHGN